ncbi:MAG TPA: preprotein translocase subunit SecE [Rectinemataceae bacterium]|nr:preprotein translocase subunit SecE [Rectinemataceae bacterium]
MKKIVQFFKESYAELRKVVWPSRDDVISSTKVVIVSTIVLALVLGSIDFLIVAGIDVIFR